MFSIGYILNVTVPAGPTVQALVALFFSRTCLALRDYSARPGPAARCSSVDLGA
jgi:hypothetical protein